MATQREVYFDIMREVGEHGIEYARERVEEYQRRLYATDLEGKVVFYAQDKHGIPNHKASTTVNDKKFYSTLLTHNDIKARDWQEDNPAKPENWEWSEWPPRTVNDLIGCRSVFEYRAECDDPDTSGRTRLDRAYTKWTTRALNFWYSNILLRRTSKTGYGIYARNFIPEGTHIGEYTGLIVPFYGHETDGMDSYKTEIDCGPRLPKDPRFPDNPLPQFTCRLDGTKKGSIFRFMSHSCAPNARLVQMRYGIHHRIVVVVATEDIEPDYPITIFYDETWFDDENPCWCCEKKCKWERKRKREEAGAAASHSDKKANKADTGRTERDKVKLPGPRTHR
jgi:hypothetical protein